MDGDESRNRSLKESAVTMDGDESRNRSLKESAVTDQLPPSISFVIKA
jgi:hypothetical protein